MAAAFLALSILTILFDKCQMKSFEDMSILIKAIFKNYCPGNAKKAQTFRKCYEVIGTPVYTVGQLKYSQTSV